MDTRKMNGTTRKTHENENYFGTDLSKGIAALYWATFGFLIGMLVIIPLVTELGWVGNIVFISLFSAILLVFVYIIYKAYRTVYVVDGEQILIRGVFGQKRVKIAEIRTMEPSPIPLGMRLCGASLLGGWYYLPGIGKAWVSMTNFEDGVLISTKQNDHFLITPSHKDTFLTTVRQRMAVW